MTFNPVFYNPNPLSFFLNNERKGHILFLSFLTRKKICFKKLKCIPLSEYTDEVHVENIAGEEILELIMQLYKVSNMLHLTGLTGF